MRKKVCMLGSFAVGKTALIKRFVCSQYSDAYLSTVGVKISCRRLDVDNQPMELVLWDLEGRDAYGEINFSYLRGADALLLVADGTRKDSLQTCLNLREQAKTGAIPYMLLVNKFDIQDKWAITAQDIIKLQEQGVPMMHTSAKTGLNVEDAFMDLARMLLKEPQSHAI